MSVDYFGTVRDLISVWRSRYSCYIAHITQRKRPHPGCNFSACKQKIKQVRKFQTSQEVIALWRSAFICVLPRLLQRIQAVDAILGRYSLSRNGWQVRQYSLAIREIREISPMVKTSGSHPHAGHAIAMLTCTGYPNRQYVTNGVTKTRSMGAVFFYLCNKITSIRGCGKWSCGYLSDGHNPWWTVTLQSKSHLGNYFVLNNGPPILDIGFLQGLVALHETPRRMETEKLQRTHPEMIFLD